MRLDLQAYFRDNPCEYCILRMPEAFPQYCIGGDLDILCVDIDAITTYTLAFSLGYVSEQEMWFQRRVMPSGHTHVDVHTTEPSLHFKFDFIDNLQLYKKFTVDDELMDIVMACRVCKRGAWVPDEPYDLALRYMEHAEFSPERPEKIKHLHYVQARPEADFWPILKKHTSLR